MDLERLAHHLADKSRIGLDDFVCEKLGFVDADITRGRLLAQSGDLTRGHLQIRFLGCYVENDTDVFGDGEIYWWSIPVLIDDEGAAHCGPLFGLPTGAPPHKCGDHEWMTNLSLASPPVWAVVPPDDMYTSCVIRLAIYDDDRDPADLHEAINAGLRVLVPLTKEPKGGAEAIISPVRDEIFTSLKAEDDDILIEQDLILRKGVAGRFGAGMINSVVNGMARAYYVVEDTKRTDQFGPISLRKGQTHTLKFDHVLDAGGRVAIFSRGAPVSCPMLGELDVDRPFLNEVLKREQVERLKNGIDVIGTGPAKLLAFYTPSYAG